MTATLLQHSEVSGLTSAKARERKTHDDEPTSGRHGREGQQASRRRVPPLHTRPLKVRQRAATCSGLCNRYVFVVFVVCDIVERSIICTQLSHPSSRRAPASTTRPPPPPLPAAPGPRRQGEEEAGGGGGALVDIAASSCPS